MKKPAVNLLVDVAAFAAFVLLTATGVLVRYVLPPHSGEWATVLGFNRHEWGNLHFWIAVVFLGTLSLHLLLHWKWIVCRIQGRQQEYSGARIGLAIVGLVAFLALAAAPLLAPVEWTHPAGHGDQGRGPSSNTERPIQGFQTLQEVAELAGMPLEDLVSNLSLPETVDKGERLGRLSRTYGFSLQQVRQVVANYQAEEK